MTNIKRTSQQSWRMARAYLAYGLWKAGLKQWAKHAPFYMLRHRLLAWNTERVCGLQQSGLSVALSVQDLNAIRQMISLANQQSGIQRAETELDQWFFMAIGAIGIQSQTGVAHAWDVFDQSMHRQLGKPASGYAWSFGVLLALCMLWMMLAPVKHTTVQPVLSPLETTTVSQDGSADPVTLSLLNLAYQKMRSGSCQLPQAAMLPEAQRQAYLQFVTEGKVYVEHVEDLRQALGYVSCLYPQELMRPQGRDRITRL